MPHEERSEYSKKMAPQTFSFITQEDPDKFKSRGTKRKIRSHVASTQHRNNRLTAKDARQTRFRTNLSIQDFERVHSPPSKRRPASKNDRKVVSPHTKTIQRRRNRSSSPSPTHEKDLSVLASPERNRAKPASGNSHTMFLARQSDLTSQATAAVYPVTYESWFDWLTSYWYERTLPRSTTLLKTNAQQIQLYTTWSRRMELSEPALYYMSLLLATGIPSERKLPLDQSVMAARQDNPSYQRGLERPQTSNKQRISRRHGPAGLARAHLRRQSASTQRPPFGPAKNDPTPRRNPAMRLAIFHATSHDLVRQAHGGRSGKHCIF